MNLSFTVTQNELSDILLNISPSRPVFIWGAPGIGKSALVQKFAIICLIASKKIRQRKKITMIMKVKPLKIMKSLNIIQLKIMNEVQMAIVRKIANIAKKIKLAYLVEMVMEE